MSKTINQTKYTESIVLTECNDGFWLYDKTRGMNLSMHVESKDVAFIEALTYYQKRLSENEIALSILKNKVNTFVSQFLVEHDEYVDGDVTILEVLI